MQPPWNPQHSCLVKRNPFGLYYATCSCGYEGLALRNSIAASVAREEHLKNIMRSDPMAKWSAWMQVDELPKE